MAWTVRALAETLGLEFTGDGATELARVASVEQAGPDCLTFVSRPSFLESLAETRAGAVILAPAHAERAHCAVLLAENPYAAYARAAQLLHPARVRPSGIHCSAIVDAGVRLADSVSIGPGAVVEEGAEIGPGAVISARAFVGTGARIGAESRLGEGSIVCHGCEVGRACTVQPGAVIGADGFGFARDGDAWVKIPQIGRVVIGDGVEIGANTTIDRGALDDTVIGDGVILDNQIQIAHNVRIGDHTAMAGCVGVAGSAVIGRRCTVGGAAVILGHLEIVDDVHITAMSLVTKSITLAGTYSSGTPLESNAEWRRNAARFRQLDTLARRVNALEKNKPGEES